MPWHHGGHGTASDPVVGTTPTYRVNRQAACEWRATRDKLAEIEREVLPLRKIS
ncbi:hypothetical protein [endosymbiont of unidentified scaly snail isolate Monju]|uniref:hypothetical protein n=1 Tax=endosymbiont of unidentified scaly snail isolate Monju TaxID=1248727 RepID=UPI0014940D1E|nr:hypothetical protein [endosymbiont of unidentified scaly snail isolate Monju]